MEMVAAASQEMSTFLHNEKLGHLVGKLQEFGVDSLTDLEDVQIITDAVLQNEIGLSTGELSHLRDCIKVRQDEMEADLQPDYDAASTLDNDEVCVSSPLVSPQSSDRDIPTLSTTSSPTLSQRKKTVENDDGDYENQNQKPSAALQQLYDEASIQFPAWAYMIVIPMLIYTIIYAVVKKEWLNPCIGAEGFWLWQFTPVPILGCCMYLIGVRLYKQHEARAAAGYAYLETDIQFTKEQLGKFPVTAVNAGLAAGLLGIGGGMVIGPLFIEIGMQPQVGTSSCAYMILWTAMSGVIQYYLAGKLGWQFVLFFASFGFISGQLGQKGVNKILKRTGRPSIVVLLLGGIIGLACCVMTISTAINIGSSSDSASEMFKLDLTWSKCSYWESQ
mmetsp:Transcript_42495/g.54642  ORF Transcript_42495/g.54642 Transcript_42495/m.54642 type:complete len:389 (+) Transcript_42495:857-2023(+)